MIDLARYVPALMLAGGAGVAAKGGGDVTKHLIDTVKVVVTRFEMGGVAQALEIDATMGGSLPSTQQAFEAYVRENMRSRTGRDPAMDLWQNPYRLVKVDGRWTLMSNGPNGGRDRCHDQTADESIAEVTDAVEDDIERLERIAKEKAAKQAALAAGEEVVDDDLDDGPSYEPPRNDDVCVYLALETRGPGGKGDPIFGNQSPYKQLKH